MKLKPLLLSTLLIFTTGVTAGADDKPSFDQLKWLSGCWKGTGLGGEVEECWMQAAGDKLTGVFQLTKDGQLQFSEIVMIAEFNGKFGMRVKHFDAAFNQWSKDKFVGPTFDYIEMGERYIQFEDLRYELLENELHVTLGMKRGEDTEQVKFVYVRTKH